MRPLRAGSSKSAKGLAAFVFAMFLGYASESAATVGDCGTDKPPPAKDVPVMTIQIFNNSDSFSIYPVINMGQGPKDEWLQAWFKVPESKFADCPFPRTPNNYRLFLNPRGAGIPPRKSLTVTLPLATQLVKSIDPKKPGQFADWWPGGEILIFDSPKGKGPPAALTAALNDPNLKLVTPVQGAAVPQCIAAGHRNGYPDPPPPANCQPLKIYKKNGGLPKNDPSQLLEFTLGAAPFSETEKRLKLNTNNVDYDVSYVNTAYLPAALEPYDNKQVGYVGMTQSIGSFRDAINKFVAQSSPFKGWPEYKDNLGEVIPKLASPLEIYPQIIGGNIPVDFTPAPPWPPINALTRNWRDCTANNKPGSYCDHVRAVTKLIDDNYEKYVNIYPTKCNNVGIPHPNPVKNTDIRRLAHLYGFSPWVEYCADAKVNLLQDTPGYFEDKVINKKPVRDYTKYNAVKLKFDELQYWPKHDSPDGTFDPWVVLIHGKDYINEPNVYAYSVDDAFGNMQADATGLIIAIGGGEGLPNGKLATPPIIVGLGNDFKNPKFINFKKYGVCRTKPNKVVDPDFPAFTFSANDAQKCPISLVDDLGRIFMFKVKSEPPYGNFLVPPGWTCTGPNVQKNDCAGGTSSYIECDCAVIDPKGTGNCNKPLQERWCRWLDAKTGAFAYSEPNPDNPNKKLHHVITIAPPQP